VQSHHEEAMSQLNYLDSHRIHMGPLANERPEEQDSLESPKFVRPMKEAQEVKEGKNVHFECRLMPVNDPKMVIEWYHNGQLLQSGHRFRPMYDFGYVALDILYAYAEDSGTYTVIARNALGESQCQCLLTVKGRIVGSNYCNCIICILNPVLTLQNSGFREKDSSPRRVAP